MSGLSLSSPTGIYVTNTGILYIIDSSNYRVQQWNSGIITTVAGGHGSGSTLDKMSTSYALYVDINLNVYLSDYGNHRVCKWIAGNTTAGFLVSSVGVDE